MQAEGLWKAKRREAKTLQDQLSAFKKAKRAAAARDPAAAVTDVAKTDAAKPTAAKDAAAKPADAKDANENVKFWGWKSRREWSFCN